MRSTTDILCHILDISNDVGIGISDELPTYKILSKLYYYREGEYCDRRVLIEKMKLSPDRKQKVLDAVGEYRKIDLWHRLRYAGSGLNQSMFDVPIYADQGEPNSDHPVLSNYTYTDEFLELFDDLWERDLALRRLEWKLLKIGRLFHRDEIILSISDETVDILLDLNNDLMDIIHQLTDEKLLDSIKRSLIFKLKYDLNITSKFYDTCKIWVKLDHYQSISILADCLNSDGTYNSKLLYDRLKTRVKSDKNLTSKLLHLL